jgi:hypothetical protein
VFVLLLVLATRDVSQPVRSPQALECVRYAREVEVIGHAGIPWIPSACVLLQGLQFRFR